MAISLGMVFIGLIVVAGILVLVGNAVAEWIDKKDREKRK